MADQIEYKIHGDDMQLVEILLDPGEGVSAEVGSMMFMDSGIKIDTNTGGIMKGIKRRFAGENFFITTFTNMNNAKKTIGFSAPYPGKIIPIDLSSQGQFICRKDSYLCSAKGIQIDIAFAKRLKAGFFGQEGFILQSLQGDGLAFIHVGGNSIYRDLAPGETIFLDCGCLAGFSSSVDYDLQFMSGVRNMLFGMEGLFLIKLTGPGTVIMQSLPFSRLANQVVATSIPEAFKKD